MISGTQVRMARVAVGWSTKELAHVAEMHPNTVNRVENGEPATKGTLLLLQTTLEAAGVEFIPENGGGPGVRLKKPAQN